MKYIDCTPTWRGILPALITLLQDGNAEGKDAAREELERMAMLADLYNEGAKRSKRKEARHGH